LIFSFLPVAAAFFCYFFFAAEKKVKETAFLLPFFAAEKRKKIGGNIHVAAAVIPYCGTEKNNYIAMETPCHNF
jgi:hypothetical protein